jgi:hypothetical protein
LGEPRERLPREVVAVAAAVHGRETAIKQLFDQIREPSRARQPLWIHGQLGIGKSALLAAVAVKLDERNEQVHWCGLSRRDASSPVDKVKRAVGWDTAGGSGGRPSNSGKAERFVFVDGLDEIVNPDHRTQLLEFIAETCKDGKSPFRWILSSRTTAGHKSCGAVLTFPNGLPPLDQDGIHALLMEIHKVRNEVARTEPLSADAGRGEWIAEIERASKGLPLYLRMLCDDLVARKVAPGCAIPPSLDEYLADVLARAGLDDISRSVPLLLSILAVADVALSREAVMSVASGGRPKAEYITDAINRLFHLGFVTESEEGLRLFHDSLRSHVVGSERLVESRRDACKAVTVALLARFRRHRWEIRDELAKVAVRALSNIGMTPGEFARLVRTEWLFARIGHKAAGLTAAAADLETMEQKGAQEIAPLRRFLETARPALVEAGKRRAALKALLVLVHSQPAASPVRRVRGWRRHSGVGWLWPMHREQCDLLGVERAEGGLRPVSSFTGLPTAWAASSTGFALGDETGRVTFLDQSGACRSSWDPPVAGRGQVSAIGRHAGGASVAWFDGTVAVVDEAGSERWTVHLRDASSSVRMAAIANRSDSLLAAIATGTALRLVRAEPGRVERIWEQRIPDDQRLVAVGVGDGDMVLTAHGDGKVRAWLPGPIVVQERSGGSLPVSLTPIARSSDLVIGWTDGHVFRITFRNGQFRIDALTSTGDGSPLCGASVDATGRLVAVCSDSRLFVSKTDVGVDAQFLTRSGIASIASDDGRMVLVVTERVDDETPVFVCTPFVSADRIVGIGCYGERTMSIGANGTVVTWDLASGRSVRWGILPGRPWKFEPTGRVVWIGEVPDQDDGDEMAVGFPAGLHAWRIDESLDLHRKPGLDSALSRNQVDDGPLRASCATYEATARYDPETGGSTVERSAVAKRRSIRRYVHHTRVTAMAVNDDGLLVLGDIQGRVIVLGDTPPKE